jgi:hypothetical protein
MTVKRGGNEIDKFCNIFYSAIPGNLLNYPQIVWH